MAMTRRKSKKAQQARDRQDRVSRKISLLRREGMSQDQAVATALSMNRRGELG